MTVWTMQPASCLEQLRRTGVYRCDRRLSFNLTKRDSLEKPYRWLIRRMHEKIGPPPEGVDYPVWAWHTWDFERRAPDPDSAAFLRRTEDKVLLTLQKPESAAVLTDFDAWQTVMLGSYLMDDLSEEDYDCAAERLEALGDEALQREIEASWERVFLTNRVETTLLTRGRYIQATFWEIREDEIADMLLLKTEPERNGG